MDCYSKKLPQDKKERLELLKQAFLISKSGSLQEIYREAVRIYTQKKEEEKIKAFLAPLVHQKKWNDSYFYLNEHLFIHGYQMDVTFLNIEEKRAIRSYLNDKGVLIHEEQSAPDLQHPYGKRIICVADTQSIGNLHTSVWNVPLPAQILQSDNNFKNPQSQEICRQKRQPAPPKNHQRSS